MMMMMMPASMVAMPRSAPAAVVAAFPAGGPRFAGAERRNAGRLAFRPVVAACAAGGDEQLPPSMAPVPASLRAIQAKRKQAAARRGVPQAAATSAAECAVAALIKAVEAVQGAAAGGAAEATRGAGDAVAWVFRKVHFQSPDLAVGLLGMVASCLGTAASAAVEAERAQGKEPEPPGGDDDAAPEPEDAVDGDAGDEVVEGAGEDLPVLVDMDMEKELWSRIGILSDDMYDGRDDGVDIGALDDDELDEYNCARASRRKTEYERIIATGGANSLILSNYAQLLYEFDKDVNRAEVYFKQAVAAEPADGEAMRRYAIFLWHARGDLVAAEDMFTYAIDVEPESSHIKSSYAWFLWMTGGVGTCLIDHLGKNNDD